MRSAWVPRRAVLAIILSVSWLLQGTWTLAATTGGLAGYIHDDRGAPVVGATVTASAPSQTARATTDVQGHFVFLTLAPDTYTVSVEKDGYQSITQAGLVVFADQTQQITLVAPRALKVIATAHSSAYSLVKPGVGSDVYSVSSTVSQAAAPLGGGGQLDSAYSAIASSPGVTIAPGQAGWNYSEAYVRGSQYFFVGYEFDGVPVNRAFDNYNGSTESNLGLQELQVYTGGGPAGNSSAGTSGFINTVIKTGIYPGYATLNGGIGALAFYHGATLEAGGASPDRNFSYYVGIKGYDQDLRNIDQQDGASLMTPGQPYAGYGYAGIYDAAVGGNTNGVGDRSLCFLGTLTPMQPNPNSNPALGDGSAGCWNYYLGSYGEQSEIMDREDIVNFHFGIPRRNGQRDDIQLLWTGSMEKSQFASSMNDGGGYGAMTLAVSGSPYSAPMCGTSASFYTGALVSAKKGICYNGYLGFSDPTGTISNNYPFYADAYVYNLPFGAPIAGSAPFWYYQPNSPTNRPVFGELPLDDRDSIYNDMGVVKLQWTHPFSENAYVRAFAYSMYSDWLQSSPDDVYDCYESGIGPLVADCGLASDYELPTHTVGGEIEFADQINDKNLVQLTGNYVTASTVRWYNTGYLDGTSDQFGNFIPASPIGYMAKVGGKYECFDPGTGTPEECVPSGAPTWLSDAINGAYATAPCPSAACTAGAQWLSLWNGDADGSYNTITPKFSFVSLTDEFRPSDRWVIDGGLRYENFTYDLPDSNTPWTDFYAQIISSDICVNSVGTVYSQPLGPGQPPPAPPIYTATCPSGYSHPPFTGASPSSYALNYWSPRGSVTYTASPDTVFRFSGGRYTSPPISASVQYLAASGDESSVWAATLPLGFDSPFHPIPGMSAAQYDFSWEQHIRGTQMSFKITPFYNLTNGYQEQAFIGANFVTQAPVGQFRSEGVEGALTIGDFDRNGFAGQVSLTYTNADVRYQNYYGQNQIATTNSVIQAYNSLTKGGGGYPCYAPNPGDGNANPTIGGACGSPNPTNGGINNIVNPYYSMAPQPMLDPNAWYAPADTGLSPTSDPTTTYFAAPWVAAVILNFRTNKLALTPSLQFVEGSPYGGPMDITGLDPRTCLANQGADGVVAPTDPTAGNCDWVSAQAPAASSAAPVLYIPNPQTGSFATPGEFRNPNILTGNLGVTYDISPKLRVAVTLTNIFHTCVGGSREPWTSVYPPGTDVCGYAPNPEYVSNFYNGTSPHDTAANGNTPYPWQLVSYTPGTFSDTTGIPFPFNAYVQFQVHL